MICVVVEVDCFDQFGDVIVVGVESVLLDNFLLDDLCGVVVQVEGKVMLEVFGGVNLDMVCGIVEIGVDIILVGVLMYLVFNFDIGLDEGQGLVV